MTLSLAFQFINFGIAWAGSWKIGAIFPKCFMMPMIVGYMVVGFCCGGYVTGMLSPETLDERNPFSVVALVNNITLSFIAFSAGSELHFPSLGVAKFKEIMVQISIMGLFMLALGTPLIATIDWIMPASIQGVGLGCRWSAALLVALVQWAGSVIEVLAIYHETQGKGPVTSMMIGITMLLDMCVLVFFAVGQNVVIAACPLEGASVSLTASVVGVFGSILLWAGLGVGLGLVLQGLLYLPPLGMFWNSVKPLLVVAAGGFSYYGLIRLNDVIPSVAPEPLSLLRFDPLLVCMIGAIWANHVSKQRDGFREILHDIAPLVMPPFFTVAGATLDLKAILQNVAAPPVLFVIRFSAIALGSVSASAISQQPSHVRNHLWMTLQAQSGVTLVLVAQLQMGMVGMQPWAKGMAATIIGCVVLNQLVGPTLCRFGIRQAGESNKEDLEVTYHDVMRSGQPQSVDNPNSVGSTASRMQMKKQQAVVSQRPSTASAFSTLGELDDQTEVVRARKSLTPVLIDAERVITGTGTEQIYQLMDDVLHEEEEEPETPRKPSLDGGTSQATTRPCEQSPAAVKSQSPKLKENPCGSGIKHLATWLLERLQTRPSQEPVTQAPA